LIAVALLGERAAVAEEDDPEPLRVRVVEPVVDSLLGRRVTEAGFVGFLLLGGRAADLVGRRRIFVIAFAAFGILAGAILLGKTRRTGEAAPEPAAA
jgi:hypothetical protein